MDKCFFLFNGSHSSRGRLVRLLIRWVSAFAHVGFDNSLMSPVTAAFLDLPNDDQCR